MPTQFYNVYTFQMWYGPWLDGNYRVGSGNAWDYTGTIEFDSWEISQAYLKNTILVSMRRSA